MYKSSKDCTLYGSLTGQNHKGTTFVAITDCPNLKSLSCYFWEELRDSAVNAITGAYHHGTEPVRDDIEINFSDVIDQESMDKFLKDTIN